MCSTVESGDRPAAAVAMLAMRAMRRRSTACDQVAARV